MIEDRIVGLIGDNPLLKIKATKVLLVGVGGVGGYIAEILARSMIGTIILVDGDKVEESNINRQLIATIDTIGRFKVDVMKERILSINHDCKVITYTNNFNEDTKQRIFSNDFDYIVDAIDSVPDKILLIQEAHKHDKYIISAMGAGNRTHITQYKIMNINETKNDPLARKIRQLLKKEKINKFEVCCATDPPDIKSKKVMSMAYNPALMGVTIAGHLVNKIIEDYAL